MRRRVVAVVIAVLALVCWSSTTGSVLAAPTLPSDPATKGTVGLCDRAGKPVTSGSIDDKPFVWRAVGSEAAPSPFDGEGAFATLYAFQPRPGVAPDQWSGDTLTAGSAYTNKAHPMAQATQLDFTLADLLGEYPTKQDGLLQLRLYHSAPEVGPDTSAYAATYLQVTGNRWAVVQGTASFSCTDGSATSSEVSAGIVDQDGNAVGTAAAELSASAASAASAAAATPGTTAPGSAAAGPTATPTASGGAAAGGTVEAAARVGDGSSLTPWIVLAVAVVAVLAAGAWWWRRRQPAPTED